MGWRAPAVAWAEWSKSRGEETGQELRKDAAPPQGRGGNRGCRHTCPLSSQKVKSVGLQTAQESLVGMESREPRAAS